MKKLLILAMFVLSPFLLNAQEYGKVYDNLKVPSKILKGERNFSIYLPPGYDASERSYPVLYLLHGYSDNHTGWIQFGEVNYIADKAINEGKATPMIIVMPDADTDRIGYFNTIDGDWNYEDYFFNELMPFVENKYRIRKEKRYRAIAGLSMGGGGTFVYALHHSELFSSACPLSAWFGEANPEERVGEVDEYYKGKSKSEIKEHYDKNNPLVLVDNLPDKIAPENQIKWYIDCGDDDFLFEGNSLIHIKMRKKNIEHEYRVRDGGHSWSYWRSALLDVLKFVTDTFHQK
ncbi:alpha/beta hydrolase [Flammeovirga kamogawensis]|uniref:Esterase family protein n=1 Tax=Flammeovirga kamogawensis TaxID=373891 RepID=A0ABX8GYL7_9BACT|nr:alpha/beta hydrolase-fold protein [Flammeovirga kamogawensis]MBB6460848.1 enterochelin esterase-like enzyme [Flammeovirga kamogawensis]QWG08197.1 esterase family protein [Flammeovirga kamogawensis]TRX70000.1 esterase family protein [Flammeovirga kamogawensis]